jgi:hypothetical protein
MPSKSYHETTNKLKISDFPRQCLQAAALKNLCELSVQAEREFGSTVSLGNDGQDPLDVLKDDFDKKSKSQLCEVDFDVILETAVWREFFEKHAPQDKHDFRRMHKAIGVEGICGRLVTAQTRCQNNRNRT